MIEFEQLGLGLGGLALLGDARTRSVCPENPTGGKGKGGMAVPDPEQYPFSPAAKDLGQGWKVNPFCRVQSGQTLTIMEVDGPGVIQHIWLVADPAKGRSHIIRFYWDGEETPSIETPVSDFFAVGHNLFAPVNSLAVVVNPKSAFNCYWPMPFRKHVKITFTNEDQDDLGLLTYQITYAETEVPENAGYFHAQWRRAVTERSNPEYVIVDGIRGKGKYAGTFLAWTQLSGGWFGEGEIKFFIDGDTTFPTICGTGTEDYFCGSYGFPEPYSTAYTGNVLKLGAADGPPKWSLYRWHIMDPVSFDKDLRITIQALGWWPNRTYQPLADDIASVAYWYQKEPHAAFPELPGLARRWPR
jgi:hypothetical protein